MSTKFAYSRKIDVRTRKIDPGHENVKKELRTSKDPKHFYPESTPFLIFRGPEIILMPLYANWTRYQTKTGPGGYIKGC